MRKNPVSEILDIPQFSYLSSKIRLAGAMER